MWGHTLKGAGSGYGFDAISDIGKSLEQAANTCAAQAVRDLIDQLSTYLERVDVVFQ